MVLFVLLFNSFALSHAKEIKKGEENMSGKFKYLIVALLFVFLPLTFSGCYLCKWAEEFCFDLTYGIPDGKEFYLYTQRSVNTYILPPGYFYAQGELIPPPAAVGEDPQQFPKSNAGFSIPSRLYIMVRHYNNNNTLLETRTYKLRVNTTTGKIRQKKFNFDQMTLNALDWWSVSVKPQGDLSPSSLTFKVKYEKQ